MTDVFTDTAGVVRLEGTLTPAVPPVDPTANWAEYTAGGLLTTIADTEVGFVGFGQLGDGTELLDRTDPYRCLALESGVYAVNAIVRAVTPMTAEGFFQVTLHLDYYDADAVGQTDSRRAGAPGSNGDYGPVPRAGVACVFYVPAGATIAVDVRNLDGAASRDFSLAEATLQRIAPGPS